MATATKKGSTLDKYLVPERIAILLKESGFQERCFGFYNNICKLQLFTDFTDAKISFPDKSQIKVLAPTWDQAIEWLADRDIDVVYSPLDQHNCFHLYHYKTQWGSCSDKNKLVAKANAIIKGIEMWKTI